MTDVQTDHRALVNAVAGMPCGVSPRVRRHGNTKYRDLDLIDALQEVYSRDCGTYGRGLSYTRYGELKRAGQPSEAQIITRFGTWVGACELAGIPCGGTRRPKDSYHSKWTNDDLFRIVCRYLRHADAQGVKATYRGYEEYQRTQADAPSGTMLRHRMASLGLTSWAAFWPDRGPTCLVCKSEACQCLRLH